MSYLTRFRAYQLDSAGSLFSYFKQGEFTLIDGRLPKGGVEVLLEELSLCGVNHVNFLHITSWDVDHARYMDIVQILNQLRPDHIHIPAYLPESEEGKLVKRLFDGYDNIHSKYVNNVIQCNSAWYASLPFAHPSGTENIVFEPETTGDNKNNKSLIKFFRSSGFSLGTFGDCESAFISDRITHPGSLLGEMDVMVLAHHGADNGFTNNDFLQKCNPTVAICNSNYDNQYDHPRPEIRNMLYQSGIRLFTTKTGDVLIYQRIGNTYAEVYNLISNNTQLSSAYTFLPKRFR